MTDEKVETGDSAKQQDSLTPDQEQDTLASEESGGESWQEELPPEDDFQDQDDLQEELVDEIIPADEEQAGQEGRRGKGIVVAVLLIGAALVGGLAYFQFSGGDDQEAGRLLPVSTQLNIKEIRDAARQVKTDASDKAVAAAEATGKVDMNVLFHQAQQKAAAGGAALPSKDGSPVATEKPEMAETTSELLSTSDQEVVRPLPPPPSIPALRENKVEKVETIPVKKEDIQALVPKKEETVSAKESAAAAAALSAQTEARLKGLQDQIETLKGALDKAMQNNTQLLARIESMQAAPPTATAVQETAGLQERIAQLEQKLAAQSKAKPATPVKEKAILAAKEELALPEPSFSVLDPLAVGQDELLKEKPAEKLAEKPVVKKAVKKPAPKKKVVAAAPAPWVLRAATPDAAWVSVSRESQELRRVAVGDDLDGLGRIKEIRQSGEKWELVGEKSTLR